MKGFRGESYKDISYFHSYMNTAEISVVGKQ